MTEERPTPKFIDALPSRKRLAVGVRRTGRKARRLPRLLRWLLGMGITGFIFGILAIALVFNYYTKDLPSTDQLANYDPAVVTRLYAADGKLMAEYAIEKRFFLPLSAIPKNVQEAFISAEDRNFYSHQGVDFWGLLRAVKENVTNYGSGKSMVGGSTITQQVVKNFLLTNEKSLERKIKEAILAQRISKTYSKEKILELYLNEIYLGQGTYGVAAAAINYFGKSLDELSTEEAALLAAMPKAPAAYDPAKNYKRALQRRNYVIRRMQEDGFIDANEANRALATQITMRPRDQKEIAHADFFAEEVRRNLKEMYGDRVLYEGGLFVKTTLNTNFQDYADRALRHSLMLYDQRHGYRGPIATLKNSAEEPWPEALERIRQEKTISLFDEQQLAVIRKIAGRAITVGLMDGKETTLQPADYAWAGSPKFSEGDVLLVEPKEKASKDFRLIQIPAVNGAMVVIEPQSGKVLALSGGYAYAGSEFNRATQAKRQPGSSFKPFVYLTALENGFSPTSIIIDGPVSLPQGPGLPMWTPKNYEGEYLGPTTFRNGLEKSRNAMTVRIAQMIGIKRVMRVAKRFGIYDEAQPNYSMVLGSKETTLLKLANAYAMVANGGRRVSPWLIERIDDRNGATIFRRDTRICEPCNLAMDAKLSPTPPTLPDERERVLDPRVAYQITSILQGAIQRGTGGAAKVLGRPLAGKTGTTNESRDTWFVGYTPDVVVATYVGFDTPKPMGGKETGGRVPIQGFIKFMQQADKEIPRTPFRVPAGIREIPVDRYSGQPLYEGMTGGATIMEAFLTGGPIFKPFNELQEELKDKDDVVQPIHELTPEDLGGAEAGEFGEYTPPGAGEMAPYQRPVDPEGFNPDSEAEMGTGGLY